MYNSEPTWFLLQDPLLSLPYHLKGSSTSGMGSIGLNVVSRFRFRRANVSPFNVASWAV